ncbi:MAG TPA: sulfate adenylate transferase [Porphyromonadaceae bacterium]|nr:sulfate adenylate transferase [Porphyromonadaceae bacterium]
MKILVLYSGGKDSQACLIESVKKYGADRITAVFCDTGWEHPLTYNHIQATTEIMGIKLVVLKPQLGFIELAKKKKRFPSVFQRFCTIELKIKPTINFILSLSESVIVIEGVRAQESKKRAEMSNECMYFRSYFDGINGKKESYRRKEVIEWCSKYDASVIRPIFKWDAQQVIDCILNARQKPNQLYYKGYSRVGCMPCIMSRMSNIRLLINDAEMKKRLIEAERYVGKSFFAVDTIPKRFCKNGLYAMADEVFKYVEDKNATLDMFEPEGGYVCMSMFHGLCE